MYRLTSNRDKGIAIIKKELKQYIVRVIYY
jgi:hypothetical protein